MNIEEYEFSDFSIINCTPYKDGLSMVLEDLAVYPAVELEFELNKRDIIQLAKHFKLTAEDLE